MPNGLDLSLWEPPQIGSIQNVALAGRSLVYQTNWPGQSFLAIIAIMRKRLGVSTTIVVPLNEYLATSYRPDCEYLDGELLERNVGEWDHSRLQMLLSPYLSNREKQWGIIVVPEQRVQVKATRFRVPDISVLVSSAHCRWSDPG